MKTKILLPFLLSFTTCAFAQWTTNGINIYNSNTGGVGIRTTTPDAFQVNAVLNSENAQGVSNIRMGVLGGAPRLIFDMANATPFQMDNQSGQLRIFNPCIVRMVINPNGNVGINTNSPGTVYKLAVAGKIAAWDEIKVFTNSTTFPDYVFAPEYKLRSLAETEQYIKENSHLPEVPSAAEIAKDGMSLNGMSEILLKKVEELTLHLIEMKKENEALKERVDKLEKK